MNGIKASSILVLIGIVAVVAQAPDAAADRSKATVINAPDSYLSGCEVTDECFIPHTVTIDVGGVVTWVNEDTVIHTTTSGIFETRGDGIFDSDLLDPGSEFSHQFEEVGEYQYFCAVHPWMTGLVVVQSAVVDEIDTDLHTEDEDAPMGADDTSYMIMELSDGTEVMIKATKPAAGESMRIDIIFKDSEHTNYDILATQGDMVVLNVTNAHEHMGMGTHMTDELTSDEMADVTVTFQGYGVDEITGPQNERLVFMLVPDLSMPEAGMNDAANRTSGIITASGSAATTLDADLLNIELGVSTVRDTAVQALNENSDQINHVINTITSLGINEDDLNTVYLNLYPKYRHQHNAETGDYTQELIGYEVTNMLHIGTDQLDKAADILDGAVSAGANQINNVRFDISPERESEARDSLISAAVDNAKHKAMLAIAPLDYHIVGVKSVVIVDADIVLRDEPQFAFALTSSAPPVLAGSQHLAVSVAVAFYIEQ